MRRALVLLWEASDRVCGKRLKPLLPERHGRLELDPVVRAGVLAVSAATVMTAWANGTPRPTEQRSPLKVRWWRSRKDPFESTWAEVRRWAAAEPELTGRQLPQRLQARYPGAYPDGQLLTLQRRLKGWRGEMARELVLGASSNSGTAIPPACPDIQEDPIVLAAVKDEPFGWPHRDHP